MKNQYKIDGDILIVYNRKDNREILFDAEDFDKLEPYTWCISSVKYLLTNNRLNNKNVQILAHRLIMNAPKNKFIDHINGNTLDNRKINLRIVTPQENSHNRRRTAGYYWNRQHNKWRARIKVNSTIDIHLGYYETEQEAHQAYLNAKKIYHPTAPML